MELIIGIIHDSLSFEQNEEGKYDIMITHDKKQYRTGFVYDSIKLLNEFQLRVSQTDSEGNRKFGMIAITAHEIVLPCWFDKIKPYEGTVAQAFIGDEEYRIDRFGQVYSLKFWKIRHQQ
ncbi:MAG: hypothetical protein IJV34_02565 [Prevotella sp.]|nr:hypothetical protein [Prevotella sp.]